MPAPDPLELYLLHTEGLYAAAEGHSREALEREAAASVEARLDALYVQHGGRGRGWVKRDLHTWLGLRACGGAPQARHRTAFPWAALEEDKAASAVLDLLCLAGGLTLAVTLPDGRSSLWPVRPALDPTPQRAWALRLHSAASGDRGGQLASGSDVTVADAALAALRAPFLPATGGSVHGLTLGGLKEEWGACMRGGGQQQHAALLPQTKAEWHTAVYAARWVALALR